MPIRIMEILMRQLKGITFCIAPSKGPQDPIIIKRQRFIEKLELQRQLAKEPNLAITLKKSIKNADGTKSTVECQKPVKPWWCRDENGAIILTVRSGFKAIEFEKGKSGILVGSMERLDPILKALVEAVKTGEMDDLLFLSKKGTVPIKKAS